MGDQSVHDHRLNRILDKIGLPPARGWARPALGLLAIWFLGNVGWIIGGVVTSLHLAEHKAPPGWTYWSIWCIGGGLIAILLCQTMVRLRPAGYWSRWIWFGGLSLTMCVVEEVLCYLTGTGMWEARTRFWPYFGVGVGVLVGWVVGSSLVLRFLGLGLWEGSLLCGLSGWMAEAFVVPRFIHAPLLLIWIIPLSIVSYILLILPGLAVVGMDLPRPSDPLRKRGWRYLAALLVPVGCWLGVAVVVGPFASW